MNEGPKVKICGITSLEDARFCAGAGADFLGFVQYQGSPRYIIPDECRQIVDWLHGIETVGVFVNESATQANSVAEQAGFGWIQACGTETPDWCGQINLPVIKVIHIQPDDTINSIRHRMAPYTSVVEHFLFDTARAGHWGGTGQTFDWDLLKPDRWRDHSLFIAGGITPENVNVVADLAAPFAVDLSSGVEVRPRVKDFNKVTTLFSNLRPDH